MTEHTTHTRPLCVDLDGTLIRNDLLLDSFIGLLKHNPLYLLLIPFWLLRGKAVLKAEIAKRVIAAGTAPNPSTLPWNESFLNWLRTESTRGREMWLCTASNEALARPVAEHLGLFKGVIASDVNTNLSGRAKAAKLVEQFGERNFDYCGNAKVDLEVWRHAHGAVVVEEGDTLKERVQSQLPELPILVHFICIKPTFSTILRAMRIHQWAKNLLIFVPLLAAHRFQDIALLITAAKAFVAFGLCASSVYLLNDILDLNADRQHPRKRKRPFASGVLPVTMGFMLVPTLLLDGLWLASTLSKDFLWVLVGYYILTLSYSFLLKKQVLLDALTLAALYTVRLIAGSIAVGIALSFWLLLFSMFLFMSLALVKRYAELHDLRESGGLSAAGRGYHIDDLPVLQNLGTAAGYLSVLVLALYINSVDVTTLYHRPEWIWGLCGLMLFWMSRVWLITHRGEMNDDPVVFALRDKTSLAMVILAGLFVWLAI